MLSFPATTTEVDYYELTGGINQVTPAIVMKPGFCIDAFNFEQGVNGGYRLTDGTERYDGQVSPSDAVYWVIAVTSRSDINLGRIYTETGSAFVVLVELNRIIVTDLTGEISQGQDISATQGGSVIGLTIGDALVSSESDYELNATYTLLAQGYYRNLIQQVPGIGAVRGVWKYLDNLYAFRDSADGITAGMWVESDTGWQAVPLGFEIPFNTGTNVVSEGETITGLTSGATALVTRVILESGSWSSGDAEGRLILSNLTGEFETAELLQVSGSSKATSATAQTEITLNAGGRYDFDNTNFTGALDTYRMYGANGVNRAFEFDGEVFVPLSTGMDEDTPSFVKAHKKQLFLAFRASVQNSGIGNPYVYTLLSGGAEIAAGDEITNLLPLTSGALNGALALFTKNNIYTIYGNSPADFNLSLTSPESGALPFTAQNIGNGMYFDYRGMYLLGATNAFGNFQRTLLSTLAQPLINIIKSVAIASCLLRSRNQYRLYGSDGSGLIATMNGNEIKGIMPIDAGREISCMITADRTGADDEIYFGSPDGYVYKIKGTSWDGDAREFRLSLPFNNLKSPTVIKKYRKAEIGIESESASKIDIGYELGYVDSRKGQPSLMVKDVAGTGAKWDGFTWDEFTWDSALVNSLDLRLSGSSTNVGLSFYAVSSSIKPFTVQSVVIHYTPRRLKR
jgi:hypothetical protein